MRIFTAPPGTPGATGGLKQLNAFFLLTAAPEAYNLPRAPSRPAERMAPSLISGLATVAGLALASLALFSARGPRMNDTAPLPSGPRMSGMLPIMACLRSNQACGAGWFQDIFCCRGWGIGSDHRQRC